MKKILLLVLMLMITSISCFAKEEVDVDLEKNTSIQKRINEVGFRILNANKLDHHITFFYHNEDVLIKGDPSVIKRQVVIYDKDLQNIESDDELAALIARETSKAIKTFDGSMGGFISSLHVKMAPKKYEIVADKRAVDYLVKAGYNPLGLMTYIIKTCPQARQDVISRRNLTSKRLMYIYEKIYYNYPYFLVNNTYSDNTYYQNFLLNSIENRRLFEQKVKTRSTGRVHYE